MNKIEIDKKELIKYMEKEVKARKYIKFDSLLKDFMVERNLSNFNHANRLYKQIAPKFKLTFKEITEKFDLKRYSNRVWKKPKHVASLPKNDKNKREEVKRNG